MQHCNQSEEKVLQREMAVQLEVDAGDGGDGGAAGGDGGDAEAGDGGAAEGRCWRWRCS